MFHGTFQADGQGHVCPPCLTRGQLASMGVDTGRVPGMATLVQHGLRAADHAYRCSRVPTSDSSACTTVPRHLWVTMRAAIPPPECGIVSPPG